MSENHEPLSDHPLFRALVLMGGGLALSCGGVARTDDPRMASSGSSGASGSSGVNAQPGGASQIVITDPGPVIATGGSSSTGDAGVPPRPLDCPTEQYSCTQLNVCDQGLSAASPMDTCVCDHSRPTSVKDCKPDENFVCYQGYLPGVAPSTWDGTVHVQCACIPSPIPATYETCRPACAQAFPNLAPGRVSCLLPSPCTYDAAGACTATAADVLYQDGIMCGCANITLK